MIDPACTGDAPQAPGSEPPVEIDIQRIMQMIPHRQPFLMIDKVVDVVANARATGIKNVSINEQYFQGHFPARPVMPGVLIIEAMAQTAAVLVVHTLGPRSRGQARLFHDASTTRASAARCSPATFCMSASRSSAIAAMSGNSRAAPRWAVS